MAISIENEKKVDRTIRNRTFSATTRRLVENENYLKTHRQALIKKIDKYEEMVTNVTLYDRHQQKFLRLANLTKDTTISSDNAQLYMKYLSDAKTQQALTKLAQDGSALLNAIRVQIGLEEIEYVIVLEEDEDRYEVGNFTHHEILDTFGANAHWSHKSKSIGNPLSHIDIQLQRLKRSAAQNARANPEQLKLEAYHKKSELYESLAPYFDRVMTLTNSNAFNAGRRWELFYRAKARLGSENVPIPNLDFFMDLFMEAQDRVSGLVAGDEGNVQLKGLNASYTSLNNIVNTLEDIKIELQKEGDSYKNLQQYFERESQIGAATKTVYGKNEEEWVEVLRDIPRSLGITIQ